MSFFFFSQPEQFQKNELTILNQKLKRRTRLLESCEDIPHPADVGRVTVGNVGSEDVEVTRGNDVILSIWGKNDDDIKEGSKSREKIWVKNFIWWWGGRGEGNW